jgi:DNA-binding NtrC family response regulator
VTKRERPAPPGPPADGVRALLVVAPGSTDRDDLFRELAARACYRVRYAAGAVDAGQALEALPVALLIAAPEVPTAEVTLLLASKERWRPGIPVLVIRNRQAEEPAAWARKGVGVLRCPLLPEALSRSVDVVLGLGARCP